MDRLLYARAQMGLSLAFHMIFAAAGVALPLIMVIFKVFLRKSLTVLLAAIKAVINTVTKMSVKIFTVRSPFL